ncbi:hypothetical protein CFC21_049851 [Triticum aestivum]|uniref:F-box associated domain-containing protein n=2 Tax=Triticum aestivum TaxID=4565 RepID=A0A9R1G4A0_WHEAT|nr:putative F-box protein At1g32420 [Triticum aestivum]KAF7039908.1 hypothetical protein CFC21_049851 [Triticum aestivum]
MAEEAAAAAAAPLLEGLPDEIVLWEILVRLDPKSLLRCRAVRRAWRCATSTRRFLLAHHARQSALPIFSSDGCRNLLALDHRAAQLHTVARHDEPFFLEASCDGLLLSRSYSGRRLAVYNPATREHASLGRLPSDFRILGMYPHRPTGEYRLLLTNLRGPEGQIGCHVLTLGSDQPPRYIGWLEMVKPLLFEISALFRDSLHWFLQKYRKHVLVFDTTTESFRHMRAPLVLGDSDPGLFEMDGTLGINCHNDAMGIITIWVLQDYESEVWDIKYRIKLPVGEIREKFGDDGESWGLGVGVLSGDGDVLLLLNFGGWLLQVDSDGKLIESFDCGHRDLAIYEYQLKQSLVQHTFFPALKSGSAPPLI